MQRVSNNSEDVHWDLSEKLSIIFRHEMFIIALIVLNFLPGKEKQ